MARLTTQPPTASSTDRQAHVKPNPPVNILLGDAAKLTISKREPRNSWIESLELRTKAAKFTRNQQAKLTK